MCLVQEGSFLAKALNESELWVELVSTAVKAEKATGNRSTEKLGFPRVGLNVGK